MRAADVNDADIQRRILLCRLCYGNYRFASSSCLRIGYRARVRGGSCVWLGVTVANEEQSAATDLDGVVACQGLLLLVARTNGWVRATNAPMVFFTLQYCCASSGSLRKLPEFVKQYSSTKTSSMLAAYLTQCDS